MGKRKHQRERSKSRHGGETKKKKKKRNRSPSSSPEMPKKKSRLSSTSSTSSGTHDRSSHKKKIKKSKSRRKEKKCKKIKNELPSIDDIINQKIKEKQTKTSEVEPPPTMQKPVVPALAPMTKSEYDEKQSVIKRVFDGDTGRMRLVKGDGEILEEIVSASRQKEINKNATLGDGNSFQSSLSSVLNKR